VMDKLRRLRPSSRRWRRTCSRYSESPCNDHGMKLGVRRGATLTDA
jgi:hypothetical protein